MMLGTAAAAIAVTGLASAQNHSAHDHHGGAHHANLVMAAVHCKLAAEDCLKHCMDMFATGDTSLALCAATSRDTIAACGALATLAASDNKHLNELAAVTVKICKDCEVECRKHETHALCKACADSCVHCIKKCEELAG
jgi:Cys-rich four helix bundle protein (predicted Tat secretion target)